MKIDRYFHLYGRKNDVVFEEVDLESLSICDNCTEEFDFCPHCGADMRGE